MMISLAWDVMKCVFNSNISVESMRYYGPLLLQDASDMLLISLSRRQC